MGWGGGPRGAAGVHDLYVVQVLPAAGLAEPQAWYRVLATVPAAAAFPPNGICRMVP